MKYKILVYILFSQYLIIAQVHEDWISIYKGPSTHGGHQPIKMKSDDEGNIFVMGRSFGNDSTGYDFLLVKYDFNGFQVWANRYDSGNNIYDVPIAFDLDNAGNVYITGRISNTDIYGDFITIKYNKQGNKEWEKTYHGPANYIDTPSDLMIDNKNAIYVIGESAEMGLTHYNIILKYNSNGDTIWTRKLKLLDTISCNIKEIRVDSGNNIYLAGYGSRGYLVVKFNEIGTLIWASEFTRPDGNGRLNDIKVDIYEKVYITGIYDGKYTTVKYNNNGMQEWYAIYESPDSNFNEANSLDIDLNGNIYITGTSDGDPSGYVRRDIVTIKYDSNGNQQWVRRIDELNGMDDFGNVLKVGTDNSIFVSGQLDDQYYTICYNPNGEINWKKSYRVNSNTECETKDMIVDCEGNVFVTGWCKYVIDYQTNSEEIATIKYRRNNPLNCTVSIGENMYSEIKVYPNPTRDDLYITGVEGGDFFQLYDMFGIEVLRTQINTKSIIRVGHLPSGIYIYAIKYGKKIGKLIIP